MEMVLVGEKAAKQQLPLSVERGPGAPPYGETITGPPHPRDLRDKCSVQPSIRGFLTEDLQCFLGSKRLPVRPVARQCVINVRHLQNARLQRDFLPIQPVGISAAVHTLMMMPDQRKDGTQAAERRADLFACDRMLAHNLSFFRVQARWLQENVLRHGQLSDVVKQAA